jgi:hypothetical protein
MYTIFNIAAVTIASDDFLICQKVKLGGIVVTPRKKPYKVLYKVAPEKGILPCKKQLQQRTGLKTKNPANSMFTGFSPLPSRTCGTNQGPHD